MVKIIASVKLDKGVTKRCTFQSKKNRLITMKEIQRVMDFVQYWCLENNIDVKLKWTVGFEHDIVSGINKIYREEAFKAGFVKVGRFNRILREINSAATIGYGG